MTERCRNCVIYIGAFLNWDGRQVTSPVGWARPNFLTKRAERILVGVAHATGFLLEPQPQKTTEQDHRQDIDNKRGQDGVLEEVQSFQVHQVK